MNPYLSYAIVGLMAFVFIAAFLLSNKQPENIAATWFTFKSSKGEGSANIPSPGALFAVLGAVILVVLIVWGR